MTDIITKDEIGNKWIEHRGPYGELLFKVILLDTVFEFGTLEKVDDDKYILTIEYPRNK